MPQFIPTGHTSIGIDVDRILNQGRALDVRARLRHKLDYLWRSCTGELSEQNDLFRLTYALELARQYDWVYHVLSDSEWSGRRQIQPPASVNSICRLKSALDIGFNDDGAQVIGYAGAGLNALLKRCGWEAVSNDEYWKLVTLGTGCPVKNDLPVSGTGVNISKTDNDTFYITVSQASVATMAGNAISHCFPATSHLQ